MAVWYFAYGSNMQSATLRGRRGVDYQHAIPARVAGWQLVFDKPGLVGFGTSYANIVPNPNASVLGVLFAVSDADLEHIDFTEGVLIGNYRRIAVPVTVLPTLPDPPRTAFTLTSDRRDPTLRPSHRYMAMLIEGAREHGLPEDYIAFLHTVPAAPEPPEAVEMRALIDDAMRRR